MRSLGSTIAITATLCAGRLALGQAPTPTPIDSNIGVQTYAQTQGEPCPSRGALGCGGCYPAPMATGNPLNDAFGELNKVNPGWQAIGPMLPGGSDPSVPPDSLPVRIQGTVVASHAGGVDFPASHTHPDQNTYILLDPDYNSLSATGNDTPSVVGMEWESNKYPPFAWAAAGDRIVADGRWIFDCGHPGPSSSGKCSNDNTKTCNIDSECSGGGTCSAPAPNFTYSSEMHPPHAVAVFRDKAIPGKHPIRATRADVYISNDGGGAGDRCNATHLPSATDVLFSKDCFKNHCSLTLFRSCSKDSDCAKGETCIVLDPANRLVDINAQDFQFDMPLPPMPPSATLKLKTKSFKPRGGRMPKASILLSLTPTPHLHVSVPMTTALRNGKLPNVFAQRIVAGWREDTTPLTHVRVKFKSLTVNNPLKEVVGAFPTKCTKPTGCDIFSANGCFLDTPATCTKDADCPASACGSNSKTCHRDSDCPKKDACQSGASQCVSPFVPGWEGFGQVNGDWIIFKHLDAIGASAPFAAPPYVQPATPLKTTQSFTFNEYVQASGTIHIGANAHSWGCIAQSNGQNLKDNLNKIGLLPGAACLLAQGWSTNGMDVTHSGPNFTTTVTGATCTTPPGQPTTCVASPGGDGGTCSVTTNRLCVQSSDCPMGETCNITGGAFTLEYTIKVIP